MAPEQIGVNGHRAGDTEDDAHWEALAEEQIRAGGVRGALAALGEERRRAKGSALAAAIAAEHTFVERHRDVLLGNWPRADPCAGTGMRWRSGFIAELYDRWGQFADTGLWTHDSLRFLRRFQGAARMTAETFPKTVRGCHIHVWKQGELSWIWNSAPHLRDLRVGLAPPFGGIGRGSLGTPRHSKLRSLKLKTGAARLAELGAADLPALETLQLEWLTKDDGIVALDRFPALRHVAVGVDLALPRALCPDLAPIASKVSALRLERGGGECWEAIAQCNWPRLGTLALGPDVNGPRRVVVFSGGLGEAPIRRVEFLGELGPRIAMEHFVASAIAEQVEELRVSWHNRSSVRTLAQGVFPNLRRLEVTCPRDTWPKKIALQRLLAGSAFANVRELKVRPAEFVRGLPQSPMAASLECLEVVVDAPGELGQLVPSLDRLPALRTVKISGARPLGPTDLSWLAPLFTGSFEVVW